MNRYFSGLTLVAALMFSFTGCAPADPVIDADPYGDTGSDAGSNTTNAAETPAVSDTPAEEPVAEEPVAEEPVAEEVSAEEEPAAAE